MLQNNVVKNVNTRSTWKINTRDSPWLNPIHRLVRFSFLEKLLLNSYKTVCTRVAQDGRGLRLFVLVNPKKYGTMVTLMTYNKYLCMPCPIMLPFFKLKAVDKYDTYD